MKRGSFRAAFALASLGISLGAGVAFAQIPPDDHYLSFETEHFKVVFPDRLESFARQAAASAEWAYAALSQAFLEPPKGRIALVITDHTDAPNASTTPVPRNRVTLIATPDIGTRQLNYYTDWLDLTLAHELTHSFHLDRADGWFWDIPRAIFGRVPILFPAFYQPRWVIEGLATYYETRLTGAGRTEGSFFDMLLASAAREDALRSVDLANGLTPQWPAANPPYAYGSRYFAWLAEQYGDSAIGEFARRGAARFPYTVEWAATPVFGQSLSAGWDDWRAEFSASAQSRADSLEASGISSGRPLSGYAWEIPAPRFSPDGRSIAFTLIDPRADASTVVVDVESGRTTLRVRRNGAGSNAWSSDGSTIFLQAPEFNGRYRIYTDLYTLDVASGKERRLTNGARIGQHDLAPDGRTLVAVQVGEGSNRLVLFDAISRRLTPLTQFADSVNWMRPRWSPDGRFIAVGRWKLGEILDLVVLNATGDVIRRISRDEAADVVPAWSPDGRYILWASDRSGVYDIFAADLAPDMATDGGSPPIWRVTRSIGGALDPDVSPDGRWLAYATHHARGYRVELLPFDPTTWTPAEPVAREVRPQVYGAKSVRVISPDESPTRGYSPFPSLWPTWWLPVVATGGSAGTFVGATTAGTDYINRHAYGLIAGWRTGVNDVEAALAYFYDGFGQPTLRLTASQDWASFLIADENQQLFDVDQRERELELAALFLHQRQRSALAVTPLFEVDWVSHFSEDPAAPLGDPSFTDLELGLVLGYSRARGYPLSVSAEKGYSARLDVSHRRLADDLDRWRVSGELTLAGYNSFTLFGYAHHVLAARLAFGASDGHQRNPEFFSLGGIPGRSVTIVPGVDIGGGADYPVRGFDEGVLFGDRIAAASLEYRFPLALLAQGHGLWPVLLDRLSASFFADGGSAWLDSNDVRGIASAGAELSLDLGVAYAIIYRFRAGLARQLAVPTGDSEEWRAYLTAGVSF